MRGGRSPDYVGINFETGMYPDASGRISIPTCRDQRSNRIAEYINRGALKRIDKQSELISGARVAVTVTDVIILPLQVSGCIFYLFLMHYHLALSQHMEH